MSKTITRFRDLVTAMFVALISCVFVASGGAHAAARSTPEVVNVQSASNSTVDSEITAGAPQKVAGFTPHCRQRMAERGFTEDRVRLIVAVSWDDATPQGDGTWRYDSTGDGTVVLNNNGWCVTVF
jgi:hypothetical protein